ncbi:MULTISPECIES: sugar ABC transporter ATP-binding protein [Rhizobium/Agrobacterium group]|uniref:sugar ABC transporter ATP-binding protein n=1 Tax=Rhizobium/Agrobacterium group TaxID=227290 RepID=UPI00107F224B|nr:MULTISPECIES: sugar ABC transporter ATP-binding protein [Rhizobium/Agrobacterium group]MBB4403052.1 ribose transport system ATP-binding protein [Agrobacterium radiobacter]MBB5589038.1 ribose transport system ATP-binding protein [Agrobacterium radiobacter]TGE86107.1 sugar ABC transporter ATP-binding protein [Rhizobium sp. SEMIA 4032]
MEETLPFSLRNVSKSFGPVRALNNVSLSVRANEVLGLIGENGAGKSSLLKVLSGTYQPDAGDILVRGRKQIFSNPAAAASAGVGVVHQEQSLVTNLSVAENILMSTRATKAGNNGKVRFGIYNWRKINDDAAEILARIGSTIDPKSKVEDLSFADRQMVEIAKALQITRQPGVQPIIVLDEPTSVLEDHDIQQLEHEVRRLKEIGSVIFVSHRLDEVMKFCDRICVMRNGEVVGERLTKEVDEDELFRLMTGRHAETTSRERKKSFNDSAVVLDLEGLEAKGKFSGISLKVRSGEIHALVGTNHSGREEVCRAVFGAEGFDAGTVRYNGKVIPRPSVRGSAYGGIAYLPSERKVESMVAGMTVAENLQLTHRGEHASAIFVNPAGRREKTKEWISKLSIRPPIPDADIASLSGGNQQKVVLAKWLEDPKLSLLILDHPTRGIDPGAREDVSTQVFAACEKGAAVLLIADTLEEAISLADTITVMRDGEITATFDLNSGSIPTHAELVGKMI